MASDDEDDYMSFAIVDATTPAKETPLQRTARLKKEAAERGRVPSKAEKAAKAQADRDAALATQLDSSNKGAKMMAKMGFKGGALGKSEDARTAPIELLMKDDKGGIGMDSEKKRKVREAAEQAQDGQKRQKVGLDEYRERNRSEQEEKRAEGLMIGAMKVLEGFESEAEESTKTSDGDGESATNAEPNKKTKKRHLRDSNVLYRPLIRRRLEKERDRKMRRDLNNSLSMRNDEDDSGDDKPVSFDPRADDLDDEDLELAVFEALPAAERLEKIVAELRTKWQYCYWCKYRYPDAEMDGCPGLMEDEHG